MESNSMLAKKELVFSVIKLVRPIDVVVILSSVITMYLFRLQDGYQLNPIWQLKHENHGDQQMIQVQPLIADLDGNGLKELIIASEDKIEVFLYHSDDFNDEHDRHREEKDDTTGSVLYHLHQKAELSFREIHGKDNKNYPIAMNSGCITTVHNDICSQVLAIVWSDWTVTLLSNQLKVLWTSRPMNSILSFEPKLQITEMSILVAAGNKSVFGENGLVIVGGVLNLKDHKTTHFTEHDHRHSQRSEVTKTAEEISHERAGVEPEKGNGHAFSHDLDPGLAKYVGHFTSYALDGGTGKIKWKHEPGDFELKQADTNEEQDSLHFKLRLKKKALHRGEVHWKKYSESFINHLPFSWAQNTDTDISLGEFKRASKPRKKTPGNMAEQFMALARTGNTVTSEKKIQDFNVVVIRHSRGIEVLNLDKGNPVCSLPLDAKHSTLADVDGDENIDLVKLHVDQESSKSGCFLVVSDALVTSSVLFNSSVCRPTQVVDFFGEASSSVNEKVKLESLPPLLTTTVQRSFGILPHVLGHGLSKHHVGMDTVVLTSTGKLSAFEPSGRFLWQVDTDFTWSEIQHRFSPSMKAISLSLDETQDGVIVLGPRELMVFSLVDGSRLTTHSLPCVPTRPLVHGDINNDISNEFLVRCSDRYIAFSLERYNRVGLTLLVYSGIACLVGFVLFVIKFIEREEFPYETFDHVVKSLRLFPVQGVKL